MKAVVYATKGAKSEVFSAENMVLEIWVENLGLCINEQHGIFRESTPRKAYKHFGTFNLSDEFCEIAREYLESRDFFQGQNAKVFTALKQKLEL